MQMPGAFELNPKAHRIGSDAEALAVARQLAGEFIVEAAERDRELRLPAKDWTASRAPVFGRSLCRRPMAVPMCRTLAEVIAIISAADPSLGQLPQNNFAALDAVRVTASEERKKLWFSRMLEGCRLGNASRKQRASSCRQLDGQLTELLDNMRLLGRLIETAFEPRGRLLSERGRGARIGAPSLADVAPAIHELICSNGAGKTTLFNLLTGTLRPDAGAIRFDGRDIVGAPPFRLARLGVGRTFQKSTISFMAPRCVTISAFR
jgi:hypothetical protein